MPAGGPPFLDPRVTSPDYEGRSGSVAHRPCSRRGALRQTRMARVFQRPSRVDSLAHLMEDFSNPSRSRIGDRRAWGPGPLVALLAVIFVGIVVAFGASTHRVGYAWMMGGDGGWGWMWGAGVLRMAIPLVLLLVLLLVLARVPPSRPAVPAPPPAPDLAGEPRIR